MRRFAAAVPPIVAQGGTPVSLPGDAVMAIVGAPRLQPDHTHRAARAALGIQAAGARLADEHPDWPRFRIGLNFTAIGDTANMAQRFQTLAEPGQVVIGPGTAAMLNGEAELDPLGAVQVKASPSRWSRRFWSAWASQRPSAVRARRGRDRLR